MKKDTSSTFINNMSLPIHRWFRYSAGFSAEWVEKEIEKFSKNRNIEYTDLNVFDPFSGSGTVLLSGEKIGANTFGTDSHPFISKVCKAKLSWDSDTNKIKTIVGNIKNEILNDFDFDVYPDLINKCYSQEAIIQLDKLKKIIFRYYDDSSEMKIIWLGFVNILRNTSHVGTAQWQYVLPNKTKIRVSEPLEAFEKQIGLMMDDIDTLKGFNVTGNATFYEHDIREDLAELHNKIDLVITSPPYANNYDYADAVRLEMMFLGEIEKWGDLQETIRKHLIPSCTQQVGKEKKNTFKFIENELLLPIRDELFKACKELSEIKETKGGKKNYDTMIALYFLDMSLTFRNLRKYCKDGSLMCFVVGDSAPYGVHIPVDKWMGQLAIYHGFKEFNFEKTRDRNNKWKIDRKHTEPLHEGRLWIKG